MPGTGPISDVFRFENVSSDEGVIAESGQCVGVCQGRESDAPGGRRGKFSRRNTYLGVVMRVEQAARYWHKTTQRHCRGLGRWHQKDAS